MLISKYNFKPFLENKRFEHFDLPLYYENNTMWRQWRQRSSTEFWDQRLQTSRQVNWVHLQMLTILTFC